MSRRRNRKNKARGRPLGSSADALLIRFKLREVFPAHDIASSALRHLDGLCKKQVDELIKGDSEGVELIKKVRGIYNDRSDRGLCTALEKMRNLASFHYPEHGFSMVSPFSEGQER